MTLPTILKYKLRQTYNTLTRSPRQKRLGWLLSIAFITPYYMTFIRSMSQMYSEVYENSQWTGLIRMVSGNMATIFFFVLVTTAALTLYRMFQAKDLPFLMYLPVKDASLFQAKMAESLAYAARSMILPLPICISFLTVSISKANAFLTSAIFAVGWLCIVLQLVSLSVITALILGHLIVSNRWAFLLRIIAVISSLMFLLIFFATYVYRVESGVLSQIGLLAAVLPTSLLVKALPYGSSTIGSNLLYGISFIIVTISCPLAAFYLFKARFRKIWSISTEVKHHRGQRKVAARGKSRPSSRRGITHAVITKEILTMRREPNTWLGLAILLVIFPIFAIFGSNGSGTQIIYIIAIMVIATASYSLSCIGKEGRSFILIRSLPMRISVLLRAKFLLNCTINLIMMFAFVALLYLANRLSLQEMQYSVFIGLVTAIYLAAFGTALAAMFPKFDFTTPLRAASMPGIFLLYLMAFLFGITFAGIASFGWYLTPLVLVPWAGVVFILLRIGQKRLEKMEL